MIVKFIYFRDLIYKFRYYLIINTQFYKNNIFNKILEELHKSL